MMDLTLGFTSPARRTSKIEMSIPYFKNNSYNDNVLPIPLPIDSNSPNTMFGSSEGCSIARFVFPNYSSNSSYLQKSFNSNYLNFNKGNASIQKVMVPKVPSYISISQQTIVGGFVGSKSHAGRSFFGESSQLWDAVVCKFVEFMSLAKDKTPESKLSSNGKSSKTSNTCHSNASTLNTGVTKGILSYCKAASNSCDPCIETCNSGIYSGNQSNIGDTTTSKNISSCVPSYVCDPVNPVKLETTANNQENRATARKETYSAVVDRTLKSKSSVPSNSCLPSKSITQELSMENCKSNVTTPPKQSYAEVAKSIPHKYLEDRKKVGCEMILNFKKRILNCNTGNDKKEYRRSPAKKAKHVNNSKKSTTDDLIMNRDSRWRPNFKSKRVRFQKSPSVGTSSESVGPQCNENIRKCVSEDVCTKESDSVFESDNGRHASLCEIVRSEPVKGGMRGRQPSECSLDSEDSFVVFEDYSDCAPSSSPCLSMEQISSLEEEEFDDDNASYTSSDDSDSEDDFVDFGETSHSSPVASIKLKRANCKWIKDVTAYTVPEKECKVQPKKKVRFAEGCHLAVVRPMIAWGYAYRESRRGPWEVHARDRFRFRCRIESVAPLLNMILEPNHRRKVFESRFSNN